jgi:hypothetical protein
VARGAARPGRGAACGSSAGNYPSASAAAPRLRAGGAVRALHHEAGGVRAAHSCAARALGTHRAAGRARVGAAACRRARRRVVHVLDVEYVEYIECRVQSTM